MDEDKGGSCCVPPPSQNLGVKPNAAAARTAGRSTVADTDAAAIPGGSVRVGTDEPYLPADGEGPSILVRIKPFRMAATAVSNDAFAAFVDDTGYVTQAEQFGWSYVFYHYVQGAPETAAVVGAEWWRRVEGACWRSPRGPGSSREGIGNHPAVHISWDDAMAYAAWAGGRLPTEAEWEHAARGGRDQAIYPWGDRHPDDSFTPCNIWQGRFPESDTGLDGHTGLAPARSFEPNGFGLFNMAGNCWEWTADPFRVRSLRREAKQLNAISRQEGRRVLKGGSHLCHSSYCHRYRIAARMGNTGDSTTGHIGFRLAFD